MRTSKDLITLGGLGVLASLATTLYVAMNKIEEPKESVAYTPPQRTTPQNKMPHQGIRERERRKRQLAKVRMEP